MAVFDSTDIKDTYYLLSQTPPNYDENNYFLNELQKKINADWRFRPNRVTIEKEGEFGSEEYTPIEVVLQTIKSEKGEAVSDDWRNIVFKDIRTETVIGQRYLFSYDFNIASPKNTKNVWIAVNQNHGNPTSSQVICRCNGTIGSIYTDEQGINHYHYEPVIQTTKLLGTTFHFNEVAVDPRGQLTLIAQNNKYTAQYYINQRFIIGTDKVYKVANILKTDSQYTYEPDKAGVIRIYLDIDQAGKQDDFNTRIAYNGIKEEPVVPVVEDDYILKIVEPENLPEVLNTLTIKPAVYKGYEVVSATINIACSLAGIYADQADIQDFVKVTDNLDGTYTISRLQEDLTLTVNITCSAEVEDKTLSYDFSLRLFG